MPYKDRKSDKAKATSKRAGKKYYLKNKGAQLIRNKTKKDQIRDYIRKYKEHRGCMDCGVKYPYYVLDLDHRDPSEKKFTPALLHKTGSWDKMIKEIRKCDVVCSNCHRERTHQRGHYTHTNEWFCTCPNRCYDLQVISPSVGGYLKRPTVLVSWAVSFVITKK